MSGKEGEKAQVSAELQQFIAQEQAKAQVRLGIRNKAMFDRRVGRLTGVGAWARGRVAGVLSVYTRFFRGIASSIVACSLPVSRISPLLPTSWTSSFNRPSPD